MRQLTICPVKLNERGFSKLPMRPLTGKRRRIICGEISKLPMRQLTADTDERHHRAISKLPMRQLTFCLRMRTRQ